jgi:nitrate reductase cytochrome c-type subunit
MLCTFCLLNLNNELHFIVLQVGLPHTDTQDSQSGYLTQIPKTASQATSHRYQRQPVRLPHTDTQDSQSGYLTQIPKTASQTTSHRYPRQPVRLPHTDTQDSQSGYLTQIPKTARQATSHRYPRQPVRLPHTDTQNSLCSYSLRFRFMVFNATFNNNSVIFWRSFYWWRKPEYWE